MHHPERPSLQTRRSVLWLGLAASAFVAERAWTQPLPAVRTVRASDVGVPTDGKRDAGDALASALNSGQVVDGGGQTYLFRDTIHAGPTFKGLVNAHLLQTEVGNPRNRAVHVNGATGFILEGITLQRAGDGSSNDDIRMIDRTGGLLIEKSADFTANDVEVSGGGIGSGIEIIDCARFTAMRLQARDIIYHLPTHPADDAINGILVTRSRDFKLLSPRAANIGGIAQSGPTHDNNRGIAITGSQRFKISNLSVSQVGQGLDVTGSDGNADFAIDNSLAEDCATWGFKLANSAQNGTITKSTARRCGIAGFVVSGPAEHGTPRTASLTIDDCRAEEVLGNYAQFTESFGFGIKTVKAIDPTYPRNVLFRRCVAQTLDPSNLMQFGFRNDVPAQLTQGQPNRVLECKAAGFRQAAYKGFSG